MEAGTQHKIKQGHQIIAIEISPKPGTSVLADKTIPPKHTQKCTVSLCPIHNMTTHAWKSTLQTRKTFVGITQGQKEENNLVDS